MTHTSWCGITAVICFVISFVSYVVSEIPIEAIYWMLGAIFFTTLPNELRKVTDSEK